MRDTYLFILDREKLQFFIGITELRNNVEAYCNALLLDILV